MLMKTWMGVDESGKGDYFGYLVIAGAVVDEQKAKKLEEIGVKDSKRLTDERVKKLATVVKKVCVYSIVTISPGKYNELYKKKELSNLNKILAWGHARVIENLLQKHAVDYVIVDKFTEKSTLRDALMENGRKAKIIQEIRAERDVAVAAASILARAEFLRTLRSLSLEIGYKLPKGATHVEDAARAVLEKHDPGVLSQIAKVNFKITKRIMEKIK